MDRRDLEEERDLIYEAENEEAETLMPISSKRMELINHGRDISRGIKS